MPAPPNLPFLKPVGLADLIGEEPLFSWSEPSDVMTRQLEALPSGPRSTFARITPKA